MNAIAQRRQGTRLPCRPAVAVSRPSPTRGHGGFVRRLAPSTAQRASCEAEIPIPSPVPSPSFTIAPAPPLPLAGGPLGLEGEAFKAGR